MTAPVFAKADGQVYCSYEFLAAEWQTGDMYRLTLTGVECTIGTATAYVPAMIWSNVIVETEDIKTDVQYLYAVADGGTTSPTKVRNNSILSILMTKDSGGDTSNFDNSTDSLEAISDAIVSGSYSVVADSGTSTTVVDATYTQANDYWNGTLLVCISGTNAGQARPVVDFANATGTFTVFPAFNGTVVATDTFLLISGWKFAEWVVMPDVAITDTVTTTESDAVLLELATAGQSYRVNNVRLKFADPGANTVTVKLYELINDVSTEVDSFTVTTDNYSSYYGLVDMFGTSHLAGDNLKISAVMDAGTCVVTGQYSYEKSYTA